MTLRLQGQFTTNAIEIDNLDISSSKLIYGNKWQETITGAELLLQKFPAILSTGKIKTIILYNKPIPTDQYPIIDIKDIPNCTKIPPKLIINSAIGVLDKAITNY